jgi:hypothetical protein
MRELINAVRPSQALLLGGAVLWGVIELVALNRPRPGRPRAA